MYWYPNTCNCVCNINEEELIAKCDSHNTFDDVRNHNRLINMRHGYLKLPDDFPVLDDLIEMRKLAVLLNRADAVDIIDKMEEIKNNIGEAKNASTKIQLVRELTDKELIDLLPRLQKDLTVSEKKRLNIE